MPELATDEDRLRMMFRHAWRVGRVRPAVIAIGDRVLWKVDGLTGGAAWRAWQKQLPWYLGKYIVEPLHGGIVALDDCRLDTNNETFTTFQRGSLWLHRYEEPERIAIVRFLDPDLPVVELGASIGAISCLINRRLRDRTRHVAVEPSAELLPLLERNRQLNDAGFVSVHAAVAYGAGGMRFEHSVDNLEGHMVAVEGVCDAVPTVTLGELLDRFRFERATVVCDIEGMEVQLLERESDILNARVAWLIVELHPWIYGQDTADRLVDRLQSGGFVHLWTYSSTFVFRNTLLTSGGP